MRVSEVRFLFDYGTWATGHILRAAAALGDEEFAAAGKLSHGGIRGTLVHTLAAQHGWCAGWRGLPRPPRLDEADFPTVAALADRWREEDATLRAYLDTLADADLDRDFMGLGPLWVAMLQVINHGTQHRSEVAVVLTDLGHSPGDIDILFFARDRQRGQG